MGGLQHTLVTAEELARHLHDPSWAIFDCRFDLTRPGWGEEAYLEGHIPGALYVHLERDLSAEPMGTNGRHPLPSDDVLAALFSRLGIGDDDQVVAYDDKGGPYAARLWWTLRYLGHEAAAVLDGSLPAWQEAGLPLRTDRESRPPARFMPRPRPEMRVSVGEILAHLGDPRWPLLDARAPERYRGEQEPYDPVAGHIPGARNRFWKDNLDARGRFLPAAELRRQYEALLDGAPAADLVVYCGSGVTACHDLLALEAAGLEGARLYPGSWSEWCSDPQRPVATGPEP